MHYCAASIDFLCLDWHSQRPSSSKASGEKPHTAAAGMLLTETGAPGAAPSSSSTSTSTADEHARVTSRVAGAGPLHTAESRLSPIVSAETEALMKRLRSASGSVVIAAPTLVATSAGGSAQPPLLGLGGATSFTVGSAPYPNSYGASPSFAELGLTKTAESLAASEGVAAEDANGLIVYGEPGTSLNANALLEAITTLRLPGEVLRHWHRDGQHFCFVEFTRDVDTADVAKRIATLSVGGVTLSAEQCRRITPGRDPRTHRATSEFKSSTLVLKNLPFQLRQETLTEILNRMPCAPASINYHYDTTARFAAWRLSSTQRSTTPTRCSTSSTVSISWAARCASSTNATAATADAAARLRRAARPAHNSGAMAALRS
jgi:hypothetical protein